MRNIIFCYCVLSNVITMTGNSGLNTDSLFKALKTSNHDSTTIGLYYKIGQAYLRGNSDSGLIYLNKALQIAENNITKRRSLSSATTATILVQKTDILQSIGVFFNSTGSYAEAEKYFRKAFELNGILEKLPDTFFSGQGKLGKAVACINLGNVYFYQGIYDRALEYYQQTLKYYEEKAISPDEKAALAARKNIAKVCSNIGGVFYHMKSFGKSVEYYNRSLRIFEEMQFSQGIAYCYNNLGLVHNQQAQEEADTLKKMRLLEKSLDYQTKSLELKKPIGDIKGISGCYNNIALAYVEMGNLIREKSRRDINYRKAAEYYINALELFMKLSDKNAIALVYSNLAHLHLNLSETEKAGSYDSGNLRKANEYGEKGLEIAKEINAVQLISDITGHLNLIWKNLGDFRKAYIYLELHKNSKNIMFNEEKTRSLAEMETRYETEKKQMQIEKLESDKLLQDEVIARKNAETRKQRTIIYFTLAGILLLLLLVVTAFRMFIMKRKANIALKQFNEEILQKNEEIASQRDEIAAQRDLATQQRDIIIHQQQDIKDSIRYAYRIQSALFPTDDELRLILKDYFIFYLPRDIVSGDFYWVNKIKNKIIIVASDCTGHGVPGAFMSMLGIAFLNDIVNKDNISNPAQILNRLRENIILAMKQHGGNITQQDGMDSVAITIDRNAGALEFAGANNPLYIIKSGELSPSGNIKEKTEKKILPAPEKDNCGGKDAGSGLIEIKGDKMPVSIYSYMHPFTHHTIEISEGDLLYIFSDGFADQFGGPEGKKFKYKSLKDLLIANGRKPMSEQKEILAKTFGEWKGNAPQIDDVLILGIKV